MSSISFIDVPLIDSSENSRPVKNQEKISYPRILTNTIVPPMALAIGILLGQQIFQAVPDRRIIRACSFGIGLLQRILFQANFPKELMDNVHNATAGWSFESFLVLAQLYQNLSDPAVFPDQRSAEAILNLILAKGGYDIIGDALTTVNLKKEDRAFRSPASIDLNGNSINPIFAPAFNNTKGQIGYNTALAVAGVGFTLFGYLGNTELSLLSKTFGIFLISQGPGVGAMAMIFRALKKYEQISNLDEKSDSPSQEPKINLKKKTFRSIINMVPPLAAEMIASLTLYNRPEMYLGVGGIYGQNQYIAQREFETLTPSIHEARKRANIAGVTPQGKKIFKKAYIISIVASITFFLLVISLMDGLGMDKADYNKERVSIGIFTLFAVITIALGLFQEKRFFPQENGRFVNNLRYIYHHNPLALAVPYQALTQITAINDVSLAKDTLSSWICGQIGLGLFASNFIANRIRNMSITRPAKVFTAPAYRMLMIQTVWKCFTGGL